MKQLLLGGWLSLICVGALAPAAKAQDAPPKPGPEFDILKKLVGTWDATIRMGGNESKGTATYKMECGGLWLAGDFKSKFGGQPFQGRGLDSYDAAKKKYISVWVDSMGTYASIFEGTYDPAKKTLTMTSVYPVDEKMPKFKSTSQWKDDDTIDWNMSTLGPDGKEMPVMSILYKRRAAAAR